MIRLSYAKHFMPGVDVLSMEYRLTPQRFHVYSELMTAITVFAALFLSLTSLLLAKLLRPAR